MSDLSDRFYDRHVDELPTHMIVFGYDDGYALYKDGVKVEEGHSIRIYDLIGAADGQPFTLEEPQVSETWWESVSDLGYAFPDKYTDIPKEAFDT